MGVMQSESRGSAQLLLHLKETFLHQNGDTAPFAQAMSAQAAAFLSQVTPLVAGRLRG